MGNDVLYIYIIKYTWHTIYDAAQVTEVLRKWLDDASKTPSFIESSKISGKTESAGGE